MILAQKLLLGFFKKAEIVVLWSTSVQNGSGATSHTITLPDNMQPGDVVFVFSAISATTNYDLTAADGYTEVVDIFSNDTRGSNLGIFYKVMGSPVGETVVVSGPTGANRAQEPFSCFVMILRGVDTDSVLDVSAVTATGVNSASADPPAITPVTTGALLLCVGHAGIDVATSGALYPQTENAPSGFVLRYFSAVAAGARANAVLAVGSALWQEGTVNPGAFSIETNSASFSSWCAATIAVKPA
jgi:hypothetical protein